MTVRSRLILASGSPRRAKLLREAGYSFEQVQPPFDDSGCSLELPAQELAPQLAKRKAASVASGLREGIVLGCDTLVSIAGRAKGKPANADEARRTLESLFAGPHQVFTAVCMIDASDGREVAFLDRATVTIVRPRDAELEEYIARGHWRGKAGGYNLDELQGRWQFDVQGDPTTVIGLPMRRLEQELGRFAPDFPYHP